MSVKPRARRGSFVDMSIVEFYRSFASEAQSQDDNRRMFARLSAFVIWSLVAATAVFWLLRFSVHAQQAPEHAVSVDRSAPVRGDLARLFGATASVRVAEEKAAAPSRYKLIGVMAPRSQLPEGTGAYGLALIAVDGKPPRAYAVGSRLDNDLVLQSVGLRTASLVSDQGASRVVLELPALPVVATGVLPIPGSGTAPVIRPPPPMMSSPQIALPPQMTVPIPGVPLPAPTNQAPDNFRSQ